VLSATARIHKRTSRLQENRTLTYLDARDNGFGMRAHRLVAAGAACAVVPRAAFVRVALVEWLDAGLRRVRAGPLERRGRGRSLVPRLDLSAAGGGPGVGGGPLQLRKVSRVRAPSPEAVPPRPYPAAARAHLHGRVCAAVFDFLEEPRVVLA
jgi:hypothetical protein